MAKKKYTGKRHKNQVIFKNRGELDFIVQIALGASASEGAAVGEIMYAVSQIDEDDLESWVQEWMALGERVEKLGIEAQKRGRAVSARGAYLRAFNYYRTAVYCMRYDDPRLEDTVQHFRACFLQAAGHFTPPIEPLEIQCDGLSLPGYFMPATHDRIPCPTLIFIVGGESYCEEAILYALSGARSRGYNVFSFDLPGQGVTALQGLVYRPDVEVPISAAIDAIIKRPEVDPERIVGHGVSYGGYAIARSAAFDERLAAISASTPILDFQEMMTQGWGFMAKLPAFAGKAALKLLGTYDPLALVVLEKFLKAAGLNQPSDINTIFKDWKVDPATIRCPVLAMIGEGETQAFKDQAYKAHKAIQGPTTLRVFSVEEGADAHTQGNNFPLAFQTVFDWYEQIFEEKRLAT